MNEFRISPSSLSYDLGGCHRCFAEALNGEVWPERPFPGIFARLDRAQRKYFDGKSTTVLDPNLPTGVIRNAKGVLAEPFEHNGTRLVIRGTLDAIAELDDDSIIVIDFKSSIPKEHLGDRYRPQLEAYRWALTHPQRGEPRDVSGLGLLIVTPEDMADTEIGPAQLVSTTWINVDFDDAWFIGLLEHICEIAADPKSAESNPYCSWCDLRDRLTV